jgi:hypothetical protein
MSGRVDRLLVWRSIRCDAPGLNARSHAGVENVSRWFPAQREPRQSTRLGLLRDRSLSRSKDASIQCGSPVCVVCSRRVLLYPLG